MRRVHFEMDCITVYHIIVSTMFQDGIVNAGRLYVVYLLSLLFRERRLCIDGVDWLFLFASCFLINWWILDSAIVSTMFQDGIVNAGRLYVVYVFTQIYCAQYPDRVCEFWTAYNRVVEGLRCVPTSTNHQQGNLTNDMAESSIHQYSWYDYVVYCYTVHLEMNSSHINIYFNSKATFLDTWEFWRTNIFSKVFNNQNWKSECSDIFFALIFLYDNCSL
jgi:hypothetical protein